jgi:hypothetical protein
MCRVERPINEHVPITEHSYREGGNFDFFLLGVTNYRTIIVV